MLKYIQIAALVSLVLAGFTIKYQWGLIREAREQVEALEHQAEINERNLKLVIQNLDREAEYRQIAEQALSNLNKEVPDVEYQQSLPPNIQRVVDGFHRSIGRGSP